MERSIAHEKETIDTLQDSLSLFQKYTGKIEFV